jgi:hypothetical protein
MIVTKKGDGGGYYNGIIHVVEIFLCDHAENCVY